MTPQLIVFAGVPGTGKSILAEHAARRFGIPVFSKDWLEACLWRSGIDRSSNSGWAAYELLTTLAERQLRLRQSAILDSVATSVRIRARWRELSAQAGAGFCAVETICSDEALLRRRVEGRRRGIPGWPELSWAEVVEVRERYERWAEERLVLDAARPLELNLAALWSYLDARLGWPDA